MSASKPRWEPKDVNVPLLFFVLLIVVVLTILLAFAAGGLFRALSLHKDASDSPPPAIASARAPSSEPLLQSAPRADYLRYVAAQQRELEEYGWIDRPHGVVRLPIARAMELLVQRGLPATPAAPPDLSFRQQQGGGLPPAPGLAASPALQPTPGTMTSTPTLPPGGGSAP